VLVGGLGQSHRELLVVAVAPAVRVAAQLPPVTEEELDGRKDDTGQDKPSPADSYGEGGH
jgi:hypothetical protein